MRKQLLACISLAVTSRVMAADLLVRPTVLEATYSWTGIYIGVMP